MKLSGSSSQSVANGTRAHTNTLPTHASAPPPSSQMLGVAQNWGLLSLIARFVSEGFSTNTSALPSCGPHPTLFHTHLLLYPRPLFISDVAYNHLYQNQSSHGG